MIHPTNAKIVVLTAAVFFLSGVHASQGQSTAQINDFSYKLESLSASSSVLPSLTINYGGQTDQRVRINHGPYNFFNPNDNVLVWSLGGNNTSVLGAQEKFFAADKVLGTRVLEDVGFASVGNGNIGAGSNLYAEPSPFNRDSSTNLTHFEEWTLSGNTKLTISGSILLDASVDARQLPGNLYDYWRSVKTGQNSSYAEYLTSTGSVDIETTANLNMNIYRKDSTGTKTSVSLPFMNDALNSNGQLSVRAKQTAYASGQRPDAGLTNTFVLPFELVLVNEGSTSATFGMEASLMTTAWTTVNPIPEPSTYALMLLGLAGVGAAARRQRRIVATH